MKDRYENYYAYVNAMGGARGENAMMSLTLPCYVLLTVFYTFHVYALACLNNKLQVVFWLIILDLLTLPLAIVFFCVVRKKTTRPEAALLYNGVVDAVHVVLTFFTAFSVRSLNGYGVTAIHVIGYAVIASLMLISCVYLFHTSRNGKKKKIPRRSLWSSVVLAVLGTGIGLRFTDHTTIPMNYLDLVYCLVGTVFFFCAIVSLSKYYIVKKHGIELSRAKVV